MSEIQMEKLSLTQEIVEILKDNGAEKPEGYDGKEWIEAADLISKLEPPVILEIPWCAWDIAEDGFGVTIMESKYDHLGNRKDLKEDGEVDPDWQPKPKRVARYDVLAILIWIPMKREQPEITLDEVKVMMNDFNIREITRKVFAFWGVDVAPIERQMEEIERRTEEEEAGEESEAKDTENFTE
jgi:hypothetical protein